MCVCVCVLYCLANLSLDKLFFNNAEEPNFPRMKKTKSITGALGTCITTWGSVRDSSPASSITTLFRVDLSRADCPVGRPHLATRALQRNRFSGALSRLNVAPFNFTRGRTFATSIQLSRPSGRPIKGKLVCPTSQHA